MSLPDQLENVEQEGHGTRSELSKRANFHEQLLSSVIITQTCEEYITSLRDYHCKVKKTSKINRFERRYRVDP